MASDDVQYILPHDVANTLILPSKRKRIHSSGIEGEDGSKKHGRNSKKVVQKAPLSKKKRRELEKIVENKKKRAARKAILEKLSQHQVSDAERLQFISVARMQQKLKQDKTDLPDDSLNSVAGSRRGGSHFGKSVSEKRQTPGVYFETDSESSFSDDADVEINTTTTNSAEFIQEAAAESKEEETVQAAVSTSEISHPTDTTTEKGVSQKVIFEKSKIPCEPTVYVPVFRSDEAQAARLKLPILAEEQPVVEAVKENPVVIICGETGSGKTTQLPQFLYEAGFAENGRLIGVTEPRRVAAVQASRRVAEEMNLPDSVVSYQIRYEGNVTDETRIKFMTDGVLLKEIQTDFLLSKYSAIIIDEAHERSTYTDILIGLLSRIVPLRKKRNDVLKLIIMSATLRVEDFTQSHLFKTTPPILKIDSRQYPVTIYFNRFTPDNYLMAAYRKVVQIHRSQPVDGAILVFVSGQREVLTLIRWLRKRFPFREKVENIEGKREEEKLNSSDSDPEKKDDAKNAKALKKLKKLKKKIKKNKAAVKDLPNMDLDAYKIERLYTSESVISKEENTLENRISKEADLHDTDALEMNFFDEKDEENEMDELDLEDNMDDEAGSDDSPLYCLPLYSLLPGDKQRLVFQSPPEGCRLCVVATNVAETSLTIPDVKHVVDTGKEKVRAYDGVAGVSTFVVQWISKASADQRAGRAGRTCAGHCHRLFSSAVFNDFLQYSRPEILDKPVDELVLQMKNMNITKVVNFPFPTRPETDTLMASEQRLTKLGALEKIETSAKITPLGRTMALFPVKPQYAKMLALGNQQDLMPYIVCLVAALSVREPMAAGVSMNADEEEETKKRLAEEMQRFRKACLGENRRRQSMLLGDVSVLLRAVLEFENAAFSSSIADFCKRRGLRPDAMMEARKMRKQLTEIINAVCPDTVLKLNVHPKPPDDAQILLIRQILLAGLCENVARKVNINDDTKEKTAAEKKMLKKAYRTATMNDHVFMHPESVLCKNMPLYVVYQEMIETTKKFMRVVTAVDPEWLPVFGENYCQFGEFLEEPFYDPQKDEIVQRRTCTFGPAAWPVPACATRHPMNVDYFKRFAEALLDGRVFGKLQTLRNRLLSSPATMMKPWSKLQRRTEKLLNALITKNVYSKKMLEDMWKENKQFLFCEYCEWLPENAHDELQLIWPPLN